MDTALFHAINGLAGHVDLIDDIAEFVSRDVPFLLIAVLALLWFWPGPRPDRDTRQWGAIAAVLATSIALAVNQIVIRLWDRPRPFATHPATLLLPASHDPSFPSDHATFGFAIAVALLVTVRRIGLVALVLAALLAVARVYTGEHYVSDVAAGALIGIVAALLCVRVAPSLALLLDPLLRLGRRLHLA